MKRAALFMMVFMLLLLVATGDASAQTKFAVGLRTGINFATMSFDPQPYANNSQISQGGRTGFLIGAAGEVEFSKMFAAELDLLYTLAGASFTRSSDNASDNVKLSELQIPILFKVKFLPGSKIRPYGFAGPVLGIVTSATDVIEVPGQQIPETDLKNNPTGIEVSSMDFAITFGGGAEYLFTPQFGVLLDLRYQLGLSNIAGYGAQVQQGAGTVPTWHTRGFMIQVGGMYHI
jgi:hypothetical protein